MQLDSGEIEKIFKDVENFKCTELQLPENFAQHKVENVENQRVRQKLETSEDTLGKLHILECNANVSILIRPPRHNIDLRQIQPNHLHLKSL